RIDGKRDEMHICFLKWFLHFAHPAADHRAGAGAGRINKIGNPNFPCQFGAAEGSPVLIRQAESWNRTVVVYCAISEALHLDFTQKKQQGRGNERDENKSK